MANWQWVFALSIDDEVTWAITEANCVVNPDGEGAYRGQLRHGTLVRLRKRDCPQKVIHECLNELKNSDPELKDAFDTTAAVGVSTLGVVDRGDSRKPLTSCPRLTAIARKSISSSWQEHSKGCMLDFRSLLDMFGGESLAVAAENDATAFCIAEYQHHYRSIARNEVLFYILLGDGINAGFLVSNGAVPEFPFHPEVGHIRPARYEHDRNFDAKKHTGCAKHGDCFEGLMSAVRIKRQWRQPLHMLCDDSSLGSPLDVVAAYAGALAWAGACAIAPDRFLIGGHVVVDELIPLIRVKFDELNNGYLPDYPPGKTGEKSKIQPATLRQNEGIMGGLEIARRAATRCRISRA